MDMQHLILDKLSGSAFSRIDIVRFSVADFIKSCVCLLIHNDCSFMAMIGF